MSKLDPGELQTLYESLKRLKQSADWVDKNPDTDLPIDFNMGELIALDELLKGFRNHFRRQKRKGQVKPKSFEPVSICLVLGDYNQDGHEETQDVWIECSKSLQQLELAYALGTKNLGFDFITTVCVEGHVLSKGVKNLLVSLGWKPPKHLVKSKNSLDYEDFVNIFLFLVTLGDPEIVVKVVNPPTTPTMWIGGYGLFL